MYYKASWFGFIFWSEIHLKAKREEAKDILEQAAKKNGTWKESTEEKLNLLIEGTEIDQKKQAKVEELKFFGKLFSFIVTLFEILR